MKEMLSEITASFSRNRCLWAEFTMPATNPGCKEEAMIHFLELGLYTHHYSLKFYINTLRLLSSFKFKFTFVNVKRKFEFCWFFGSPCALDGRVIGVFSGFYPGIEHEVWRSWQAREQCTTSTSFATHIIPDSFICDFLNRKKTKKNEITREKLQQMFFWLRASDRNTFLTSIPPHSLNLLSSQVRLSFRPITRQTFLGR